MKRYSLILLFVFLTVGMANAQLFKFGIKAGVSSSRVKFSEIDLGNSLVAKEGNSITGMHFGVVSRVQLLGFFVQPELYFSSTGGDIKIVDISTGAETVRTQKFNKIDIPVLVGWKFGPARLGIGPVASIVISDKAVLKDYTGYDEQFNKATFGYQIGVGLDIWKIGFDLRYEGSLSKLGDGVKVLGQERSFDSRNPQILASVALYF
ncbi:MAG TPA: porin family protein [Williamwhitmania sp.]|nr:porin family protein [Williamwhitmania sp.]